MSTPIEPVEIPPALLGESSRRRAMLRRVAMRAKLIVSELGPKVRRTFDVVLSALALAALTPLFIAVAIAIKIQDGGPILFKQERIGRGGKRFMLFKFRTMVHGADAMKTALAAANPEAMSGVRFKLTKDPRVTRVGRILRRFSIDEMPQIYNVLRGDMTLVGPRPPVWREVALYSPKALRRLEVTPGLTCLWQIGGRSDLTFEQQVDLDLEYIDKVQPAEEVAIVVKTIPAVISGRGAY
jgi:lipopolysaccharide/colanic/teichoic acid biosynthesis glycosyltransferase